jgi:rhodanese-related sulfurtransferase
VPTVTTDQLAEALTTERPVVLLDVRDPSEFLVSHLPNARLVRSADDLVTSLENISQDTLIVAYCSVGYRSAQLIKELQQRGITTAFNLEGSIFAWANAGLPVYRGENKIRQVHPFNESWGQLLQPELWSFTPTTAP